MNKKQAENIILNYKEYDDDNEEHYGYTIKEYYGDENGCHIFVCEADGVDYNGNTELKRPILSVEPDGNIVLLPI